MSLAVGFVLTDLIGLLYRSSRLTGDAKADASAGDYGEKHGHCGCGKEGLGEGEGGDVGRHFEGLYR